MRLFPEIGSKSPDKITDDYREYSIDLIFGTIKEWSGFTDDDRDIAEYLLDNYLHEHNGYEIARKLEYKFSISPDSSLVEILDGIYTLRYEIMRVMERDWVKKEQLSPKYKVGDAVKYIFQKKHMNGDSPYLGEIINIDDTLFKYTVNFPDLGHVPRGQLGTQGIVLNCEEVEGQNENN